MDFFISLHGWENRDNIGKGHINDGFYLDTNDQVDNEMFKIPRKDLTAYKNHKEIVLYIYI